MPARTDGEIVMMDTHFTEGKYYVCTNGGENWGDFHGPYDTAKEAVEVLASLCDEWSSPEMLYHNVLTYFTNNQLDLSRTDQGIPINGSQIMEGNVLFKDGVIIWEPAEPKKVKTVRLPVPKDHNHHEYDPDCEDCQPCMADAITQKPLPRNHPNQVAIRKAFKERCSEAQRIGWHKVVMGQSQDPIDKGLFNQACQVMLTALHEYVKSYQPGEQ